MLMRILVEQQNAKGLLEKAATTEKSTQNWDSYQGTSSAGSR